LEEVYMEIVLSLKEAVYLKGNESQIKSIIETGNLKSNPMKSLLTRYEEEYESVEVVGKGKNREIVLQGKRPMPIKMDKRQNNRATGRKTPFANELELLIIKALRDSESRSIEGSVGNVMWETNMAHEKLCYFKQPNRIEKYLEDFRKKEIEMDE